VNHRLRLSASTRIKAAEAGLWQTSHGKCVAIVAMNDAHLVNALLKALREQEPTAVSTALSAEVRRRNLQDYAFKLAEEGMK
jgi:hypothetical protein